MLLLNIKSYTTLQKLRDEERSIFSTTKKNNSLRLEIQLTNTIERYAMMKLLIMRQENLKLRSLLSIALRLDHYLEIECELIILVSPGHEKNSRNRQ